jgi:hypothetical protein
VPFYSARVDGCGIMQLYMVLKCCCAKHCSEVLEFWSHCIVLFSLSPQDLIRVTRRLAQADTVRTADDESLAN